ncbi:MAG: hypothetical protein GWP36_05440 [Bacteroidetes bacterium]|jgi:hypothetical protein|nr:hypothetical protein [Bacteroidota bacterium]
MKQPAKELDDKALLALGIVRTSVDVYSVDSYKYSNLEHALAQAERTKAALKGKN